MGTTAIYLYGHTHRHTIADLRPNSQPLLLNSGSTGHRNGSWNQLDLDETTLTLTPYRWQEGWQEEKTQTFTFETKAWYHQGLRFKCTGCGKCCTGAGFVWLEEEDVKNISARLELTEDAFYKQYTRQLGFDTSLIEDPVTTDCIFLEDKKFCKIYDARPKQCRTFPWWKGNLENPQAWKEAKERCEGIDHPEAPLISLPEIEKNLE
ncbi:MAG: YkgJ family cysteine cluster protein [Chlamydiia bacterium]|nr:YkgJ family cysteine cluster protein [Chlamydiia bacterium]